MLKVSIEPSLWYLSQCVHDQKAHISYKQHASEKFSYPFNVYKLFFDQCQTQMSGYRPTARARLYWT